MQRKFEMIIVEPVEKGDIIMEILVDPEREDRCGEVWRRIRDGREPSATRRTRSPADRRPARRATRRSEDSADPSETYLFITINKKYQQINKFHC